MAYVQGGASLASIILQTWFKVCREGKRCGYGGLVHRFNLPCAWSAMRAPALRDRLVQYPSCPDAARLTHGHLHTPLHTANRSGRSLNSSNLRVAGSYKCYVRGPLTRSVRLCCFLNFGMCIL